MVALEILLRKLKRKMATGQGSGILTVASLAILLEEALDAQLEEEDRENLEGEGPDAD